MALNGYKKWAVVIQEKIIQLLGSAEALERDLAQVLPAKEAQSGGKLGVFFWLF